VRSEKNGHLRPTVPDHSPFAIHHSLFAIRRLSPFAIRDSPFAVFPARCSLLAVFRGSLLYTTKRSRRKLDVSKFVRDP
jgi:hypothetical protein